MASRHVGTKPLPEPMLAICYLHSNKLKWNSNRNSVIFNEKTAFEIVVCQNGGHFIQGGYELKVYIFYKKARARLNKEARTLQFLHNSYLYEPGKKRT